MHTRAHGSIVHHSPKAGTARGRSAGTGRGQPGPCPLGGVAGLREGRSLERGAQCKKLGVRFFNPHLRVCLYLLFFKSCCTDYAITAAVTSPLCPFHAAPQSLTRSLTPHRGSPPCVVRVSSLAAAFPVLHLPARGYSVTASCTLPCIRHARGLVLAVRGVRRPTEYNHDAHVSCASLLSPRNMQQQVCVVHGKTQYLYFLTPSPPHAFPQRPPIRQPSESSR